MSNLKNNCINDAIKSAKENTNLHDIVRILRESAKDTNLKGTPPYIEHTENIFSIENYSEDYIEVMLSDASGLFNSGKMRISDLFFTACLGSYKVVEYSKGVLLFYKPHGYSNNSSATINFNFYFEDTKECLTYKIFGEVLIVGFDWETNSFRNLTKSDFERIKSLIR